jgi:hypothetical protein
VLLVALAALATGAVVWAHHTGQFVTGPCRALHAAVNDSMVVTVGAARSWGPQSVDEPLLYPDYRDTDRLAVCLRPGGQVTGIFLRDGKRITLWHQSPDGQLEFPV